MAAKGGALGLGLRVRLLGGAGLHDFGFHVRLNDPRHGAPLPQSVETGVAGDSQKPRAHTRQVDLLPMAPKLEKYLLGHVFRLLGAAEIVVSEGVDLPLLLLNHLLEPRHIMCTPSYKTEKGTGLLQLGLGAEISRGWRRGISDEPR